MKKCMTISGGFDSGCLPFIINPSGFDFVFFKYNQKYMEKEKEKAVYLANFFDKKLKIISIPEMQHDHSRRNFIFLSELKKLNYVEIIMGNRNILPFFDAYKDSNLINLQLVAYLFQIKLKLPIIGWTKTKVIKFLKNNEYLNFYNCYKNNIDYKNCDCPNCLELKKIL